MHTIDDDDEVLGGAGDDRNRTERFQEQVILCKILETSQQP